MPSPRDDELDAVQRSLERPYIEEPDERDVDIGGACFLDQKRRCGPDCTAFNTDELAPTALERCHLLHTAQQGFVLLQQVMDRLTRPSVPVVSVPAPDPFAPTSPPPRRRP